MKNFTENTYTYKISNSLDAEIRVSQMYLYRHPHTEEEDRGSGLAHGTGLFVSSRMSVLKDNFLCDSENIILEIAELYLRYLSKR
jgi:hypothetical protein